MSARRSPRFVEIFTHLAWRWYITRLKSTTVPPFVVSAARPGQSQESPRVPLLCIHPRPSRRICLADGILEILLPKQENPLGRGRDFWRPALRSGVRFRIAGRCMIMRAGLRGPLFANQTWLFHSKRPWQWRYLSCVAALNTTHLLRNIFLLLLCYVFSWVCFLVCGGFDLSGGVTCASVRFFFGGLASLRRPIEPGKI